MYVTYNGKRWSNELRIYVIVRMIVTYEMILRTRKCFVENKEAMKNKDGKLNLKIHV